MEQLFTSTNLLYMDAPDVSSNNSSSNYHKNQYTYSNMWYNDYTEKWEFRTTSD